MTITEETSDETLLELFEKAEIPLSCWNHRTHLRIAYSYLRRHPIEAVIGKLREGITAFNRTNGIEDGLLTGYHETMTCAWASLVDFTMKQLGADEGSEAFLTAQPQLCVKSLLRLYYSKEVFCSWEAKESFLAPDLAPLPQARETGS